MANLSDKLAPTGVVLLSGAQTLTDKTLTSPTINTGTLNSPTINTPTIKAPVMDTEAVSWSGTAALNPANGSLQTVTLTGNVATVNDDMADGECIILEIDDGAAYTITWPTITWLSGNGTAPTLQTTNKTIITIFKSGSTLYGHATNGL